MSLISVFGLLLIVGLGGMVIYVLRAVYKSGKLKGRIKGVDDVRKIVKKKDEEAFDRLLHPRSDDFGRVHNPKAKWNVPRKTDS